MNILNKLKRSHNTKNNNGGFCIEEIKFDLKYSKRRKTLSISVNHNGEVRVSAPIRMSKNEIFRFVKQKKEWIRSKQANFKVLAQNIPTREYIEGEIFQYLGLEYTLKVIKGKRSRAKFIGNNLEVGIDNELSIERKKSLIKKKIVDLYRHKAAEILSEKTRKFADQIGVRFKSVNVRIYKNTWGNCYSDGRINYNIKLIMAPEYIIDYVVIHELCHLIHPNHSQDYWQEVSKYFPEYKQARAFLQRKYSEYIF